MARYARALCGHATPVVRIDFRAPDAVPLGYLTLHEAFERLFYLQHGNPNKQGDRSTTADGSEQNSDDVEDWSALMEHCQRFLACENILKAAFASGQLTAEVRDPVSGNWLRVPPAYWSQNCFPPRPFACRPLSAPPRSLLGRYRGRTLLVREVRFAEWLEARESQHGFPDAEARTTTTPAEKTGSEATQAGKRGRPLKYEWARFLDEALRLLSIRGLPNEGSGRGDWSYKAALEKYMSDWCSLTWAGSQPAESTIRRYVDKAMSQFKTTKAAEK